MRHSDYRTLIDHGRRAGLGASELYAAMSSRRPEGVDQIPGEADSNGYVSDFNRQGQLVIHPSDAANR